MLQSEGAGNGTIKHDELKPRIILLTKTSSCSDMSCETKPSKINSRMLRTLLGTRRRKAIRFSH